MKGTENQIKAAEKIIEKVLSEIDGLKNEPGLIRNVAAGRKPAIDKLAKMDLAIENIKKISRADTVLMNKNTSAQNWIVYFGKDNAAEAELSARG